jgi:hypothetical protein
MRGGNTPATIVAKSKDANARSSWNRQQEKDGKGDTELLTGHRYRILDHECIPVGVIPMLKCKGNPHGKEEGPV